jgi:DNA-binding NarL/FixJ family response regulator
VEDLIRVVVVHENRLFRESVISLLEQHDDVRVVGAVAPEGNTLAGIGHEKPDVVLLHVGMPARQIVQSIKDVREYWPDTRIVVAGVDERTNTTGECVRAGASDCVSTQASIAEIFDVVQAVHRSRSAGRRQTTEAADR